jgi:hypothetical protein
MMFRGTFDIKNEAPGDAKIAYAIGIRWAFASGDGIYAIWPDGSFVKTFNYTDDEPDLHPPTPVAPRTLALPNYATIAGGTFGTGLFGWARRYDMVGTEVYRAGLVLGSLAGLVKVGMAVLAFWGHPWVLVISGWSARGIRFWEWLAGKAGAKAICVLGWAKNKAVIEEAWKI